MITKFMLIKKDIWELIETSFCPKHQIPGLFTKKVKEDQMAVDIARPIILEGLSDQIAFNIIDFEDSKKM